MAKEVEALTILLAARTAEFERGMNAAERRIQKVERQMRGSTALIERDANRMKQKVAAAFDDAGKSFNLSGLALGGIGLAAITAEAIKYSDAWTRVRNSLAVAGVEGSRQKEVSDALFESAQRNSTGIEALSDLYGKASQNARELGADQGRLLKFTDGVAVALKASGSSAQSASGALLQLSQLLGSGTVRAEEFNSVNEGAPTILKAVASGMDGTGGSIAALRTKVLAGEVSSRQFFDAFLKGKPVIDEMAAKALPTLENATTRINNALTKYVGENAGAQGATRALIGGLNYLADNFNATADVALKFAGIIAAALVGRAIGGMIAALGSGGVAIAGFLRALAAIRTAGGIAALATATGGLGAAAGPIGAILGLAAAAAIYFGSSSREMAAQAQAGSEAIKQLGLSGRSSADDIKKAADALRDLTEVERNRRKAQNDALISEKSIELSRVPLRDIGVDGRASSGQGRALAATLYDLNDQAKKGKISQDKYNATLDELVRKNPKLQTIAQQYQAIAAEIFAALKQQEALNKAVDEGRTPEQSPGDRALQKGLDVAGSLPKPGQSGAKELAEAKKTDREKAISEQTDKLIKEYASTGQKITDAVREAFKRVATGVVDAEQAKKDSEKRYSESAPGGAFDLIQKREGFNPNAYEDFTNRDGKRVSSGLAIGYGTHTVGGRQVQSGDTITREQADAELKDRIGKIQATLSSTLGQAYADLTKEQQAALTSIAYNYGKLPTDIANAVKTGTTEDVAKAIRNRASDNGGINRDRRNEEADLYSGNATPQAKQRDTAAELDKNSARDSTRRIEDLNAETAALGRQAQAIAARTIAEGYFDAQAEKSKLVREELRKLQDAEIEATPDLIAKINARADAEVAAAQRKFDAERMVQKVKEQGQGVAEAEDFFAENAVSGLNDIISGAATAQQALKKLVSTFIEAALQATLLGKGPLAGLFGTGGKDGATGGLFGTLFSAFGAAGGKAAGGRVSKGQIYPVGENGREYFSPGENGRIIPDIASRPAPVARAAGATRITHNARILVDVSGANGDDSIRRIANEAAATGARQAYAQAMKDVPGRNARQQRLGY